MKKVLLTCLSLLLLLIGKAHAQTLSAGDIAIVGFNFDNSDEFTFVALTNIPGGEQIKFTDNGWRNTNSFRSNEGTLTWTAPGGGVSCGTQVTITGTTVASTGSVSQTAGSFALSGSGDQILAYQGPDGSPTFLYAVNSEGTGWQTDATSSNTSAIPSGLTNGTNAVALNEIDNAIYNCSVTTPVASILAAVSNSSNWSGSNSTRQTMPLSCTFTCGSTNTITTGLVSSSPFSVDCSTGDAGTVAFTSTGTFTAGNIYTAQLSDASGSFASPTNIGTLSSTANSGTINITIPAATPTGSGYLIRVISSAPSTTGTSSASFTITSSCTGTDLEPGDLVFVGFDTYVTSGSDKLVITNMVPLLPNTEFTLSNAVYEFKAAANVSTGRWYNGNNSSPCGNGTFSNDLAFTTVTYNGPGTLPAGSVICISLVASGGGASIIGIDLNGSASALFTHDGNPYVQISSSAPDAIFLMQGTFSSAQTDGNGDTYRTFSGDVLGGIQTRGSFQSRTVAGNNGGCRVSRIHPQIECLGVSTGGASNAYYGYYNAGALHTGTQNILLANIVDFGSNWTMTTTGAVNGDDVPTCGNTFTVTGQSVPGRWTGASNDNWFFCGNWDNFTVPDDSTDVTIPSTALNDADIDFTALYSDFYGDTARCRNLSIDGRRLTIETSSQNVLLVNENITITNTAGAVLDMDGGGVSDGQILLYGNWVNNGGAADFLPGDGEISFLGNTTQTISNTGAGTQTFHDMDIEQTGGGVTLGSTTAVDGDVDFTSGIVTSTSGNLMIFNDGATHSNTNNTSHVNGPVRKVGNDAFTFPVGTGSDYQPAGITAPGNVTDHFTAEYFYANPHPTYDENSRDPSLHHISNCEYWIIDRTNGSSNVSVTLSWDGNSCGVTNLSTLAVARWDGAVWRDHGNGGTTGNTTAGTVTTSAAVTSFSPFTLASTNSDNPLPVELIEFNGNCEADYIELTWSTASEQNNEYFIIEKSTNGSDYLTLGTVPGAGNSNTLLEYHLIDADKNTAGSYYRLSQVDYNGQSEVFAPVYVDCSSSPVGEVSSCTVQYLSSDAIVLNLFSATNDNVDIFVIDKLGRNLGVWNQAVAEGNNIISLPTHTLSTGIYTVHLTSSAYSQSVKVFVR